MTTIPPWMADLDEQDLTFVKRFLLASGSLKEVAAQYGVSYPTVRLRLDRLIQKIQLRDKTEADPYVALVKRLAVDGKLDFDTAKILINAYRDSFSREKKNQKELEAVTNVDIVGKLSVGNGVRILPEKGEGKE